MKRVVVAIVLLIASAVGVTLAVGARRHRRGNRHAEGTGEDRFAASIGV